MKGEMWKCSYESHFLPASSRGGTWDVFKVMNKQPLWLHQLEGLSVNKERREFVLKYE